MFRPVRTERIIPALRVFLKICRNRVAFYSPRHKKTRCEAPIIGIPQRVKKLENFRFSRKNRQISLQIHSHSTVAGGLLVMSYTIRLMPGTSLTMRVIGLKYHQSNAKRAKLLTFPLLFFSKIFFPLCRDTDCRTEAAMRLSTAWTVATVRLFCFSLPCPLSLILSHCCLVGGPPLISQAPAQSRPRYHLPGRIRPPGVCHRGSDSLPVDPGDNGPQDQ